MTLTHTMKSTLAALTFAFAFGVAPTPSFAHEGKAHPKGTAHESTGVPKGYPLKKCVVSDETLGEHGKPVKVTAPDGTDVYLCCKECKKDFDKEPAKFAKLVKDAKGRK